MKNAMAKGTLWLMFARFIFLLSGYGVHIFLGRYFGPALYGTFGVILSLMNIVQMFFQKGLPQSASKFMAEDKDEEGAIYKTAIKLQFYSALFFMMVYFFLAEPLANWLNDPGLTNYIRFSSLLILPVAFFSLYTDGFFNGQRIFKYQAYIRIIHAIIKLVFVFIFVFLGFKVYGAIGAYITAYFAAFLMAKSFLKIKHCQSKFSPKKMLFFALPLIISSLVFVLMRNIDLLFIKSILREDSLAGFYTSAMTLAGVTYLVFAGSSLTLLPSVSKSTAEGNTALTKSYINKTLRYVLMLLAPATFLISATAPKLISWLYSPEFIAGAPALSILIFGSTFLTFFVMLCAIMAGGGKAKTAMVFGLIIVLISVVLNYLFIPLMGISGAALAMTIASLSGTLMAAAYVFKKFKTLIPWRSGLKIMLASMIVYHLALNYQFSRIGLILTYLILFGAYFAILFAVNEIKQEDVRLVMGIIKIKNKFKAIKQKIIKNKKLMRKE